MRNRIRSSETVYLHMDGAGLNALNRVGGRVYAGYLSDVDDTFMIQPDGQVAFRSMTYNNVYVHIDHWTVSGPIDRGTVNAQYGKFSLEIHYLEPLSV